MNTSEDQSKPEGSAPEAGAGARPAVSGSRRRLLRGGLAAAPALLALKSAPVMACNCKIPSGFSASGNLSRNAGAPCSQPGGTPTYWKDRCGSSKPHYYNSTTCKRDQMFTSCFGKGSYTDYSFNNCLARGDSDHQGLAVACYLQACIYGGTNFPTTQMVKDIWNNGVCGSGYKPTTTSAAWNKTQCISYLKYLTGQSF